MIFFLFRNRFQNIKKAFHLKRPSDKQSLGGGFTLVEMLLAASLVALVSIAAYQSMLNGYRIWQRSQRSGVEEDISLALDKISQDIRNVFSFSSSLA